MEKNDSMEKREEILRKIEENQQRQCDMLERIAMCAYGIIGLLFLLIILLLAG